ncbi:MAG: YraN family protein [Bacteroidales bacterium]|nr:YraN family protein [Bacteroidales bacterium]
MAEHNILGNKGEDAAVDFLANKGYKIKARNWRFGKLEIDIIAEHNNEIIFIEVKSRSGTYFEQPFQAVTKKKQKFIIKAANEYIEKFEIDFEARFDIISIVEENGKFKIDHIEDAFYPLV